VLDVLFVNQTTETLQNLTVEFATLGDLKVVERPPTQNVGPHDFINLQATIKGKSSTVYVLTHAHMRQFLLPIPVSFLAT
jgi:coatomer subunit beta